MAGVFANYANYANLCPGTSFRGFEGFGAGSWDGGGLLRFSENVGWKYRMGRRLCGSANWAERWFLGFDALDALVFAVNAGSGCGRDLKGMEGTGLRGCCGCCSVLFVWVGSASGCFGWAMWF